MTKRTRSPKAPHEADSFVDVFTPPDPKTTGEPMSSRLRRAWQSYHDLLAQHEATRNAREQNLSLGPKERAKKQKGDAAKRDDLIKKSAHHYWCHSPKSNVEEVARFVKQQHNLSLSVKTIKRLIAGVKFQALR
jgi:hypothetical protein